MLRRDTPFTDRSQARDQFLTVAGPLRKSLYCDFLVVTRAPIRRPALILDRMPLIGPHAAERAFELRTLTLELP